MTRAEVRALLLARTPRDAKEDADRRAMLDFLDLLAEPFSRDQERAHFTASALVVDPARGRTALARAGGEDRRAAAAPPRRPRDPDAAGHLHLDVRFLVVADGDLALSDESHEVRWCTLDEAVHLGDASGARLVASLP